MKQGQYAPSQPSPGTSYYNKSAQPRVWGGLVGTSGLFGTTGGTLGIAGENLTQDFSGIAYTAGAGNTMSYSGTQLQASLGK